jgi:glycosyltransferase involved in cell wall biosynthesis
MANKTFRFHLLSLVHLPQHKKYLSCAFTQKNRKLAKMLTSMGHEVFFYGSEGSDIEEYCNSDKLHYIQTHSLADIAADYGDGFNLDDYPAIGYDWRNTDFRHDFSGERKPATLKFYKKAIYYINKLKKPDDFLLNTMGYYWKPVEDAVGLFLSCESGIGYRGSYSGHYRAFESAFIRDFTYGSENPFGDINGNFYDRVIPNYFDPDDFLYRAKKDDYYLFIGRMIARKGIQAAVDTCNHIGAKLIIVGQGASVRENGHLVPNTNPDFDIPPGTWEYFGYAGVEDRKRLMGGAIATFTPTFYQEIFGGTHVESMLSGTPPITTDFGVYSGTIPSWVDGKIGFKCNTLEDFVKAALAAPKVNHKLVRDYGKQFLMDNVKLTFDKWFQDLYRVYESTVDSNKKGWHYTG